MQFTGSPRSLLDEVSENLCLSFKGFIQALNKTSGEPLIIRILEPSGGDRINQLITGGEVELAPDEDLDAKLQFYVG